MVIFVFTIYLQCLKGINALKKITTNHLIVIAACHQMTDNSIHLEFCFRVIPAVIIHSLESLSRSFTLFKP